mmetsp:Transcript_71456/g.201730  ORF Transcript_71456/g.201730 Transcript_71456/m.201730 type:complete len:151 (-) Transcript_71456:212-664(-)
MADCDFALITSCLCFIASCLTLVQGIAFLFFKVKNLEVLFQDCDGLLEPEDCNVQWRAVFTLRPEVLLDLWTPVILGALGIAIHLKRDRSPIKSYVAYAFFMFTTATFGNIGYLSQAGIFLAVFTTIALAFCLVARLMGEKQVRYLDIKR